ncbi:hypothetical protein DVR12_19055 [Chitinophaga silvatica]|uniref:Uncharacterized protein n=1 Tax=Chitinophaga silvatica TaxID=2282649 RepID=A0A3E1Y6V0_9BACT|nr:hypothetical protein DVR12_19055 [Chitinophaga silvatica]
MNAVLLYFLMKSCLVSQDKYYSFSDNVCYFLYTVKTDWDLHLKEHGTFNLNFIKEDSRYQKISKSEFFGIWKNQNDTIIFTIADISINACGLKSARYLVSNDTLKSLNSNICLPPILILEKFRN